MFNSKNIIQNKMNEITIVTAFFDIGRENFQDTLYARSKQKYFEQFEFWARMQNNMIVYTQPEFAEEINRIRESFGLKNLTKIIEVEDIFSVEAELYTRMKRIEQNQEYSLWGINPKALRNRADYDYIMLMKYWCIKEASKIVSEKSVLAWMDFGFNHGGDLYSCEEEFAFTWKNKNFFENRKIRLFSLFNPDDVLLCESLQLMYVCIMGCMLVVPQELSEDLWELVKAAMKSLVMLDAIDDDQQLLVMAYKYEPDLFMVHQSDWFLPLKEFGGEHLTCREKTADIYKAPFNVVNSQMKNLLSKVFPIKKKKQNKIKGLDEELAERIYYSAQKYYKYR